MSQNCGLQRSQQALDNRDRRQARDRFPLGNLFVHSPNALRQIHRAGISSPENDQRSQRIRVAGLLAHSRKSGTQVCEGGLYIQLGGPAAGTLSYVRPRRALNDIHARAALDRAACFEDNILMPRLRHSAAGGKTRALFCRYSFYCSFTYSIHFFLLPLDMPLPLTGATAVPRFDTCAR